MRTPITRLEVKWSVSRGRDTYGYNICSLWTRAGKVASCMGGGYDMLGTSLGNYLQDAYQAELQAAFAARMDQATPYGNHAQQLPDYYGMTLHNGKVSLDGGCGINCMQKIAEDLLSLSYEYSVNKKGHIVAIYLQGVNA